MSESRSSKFLVLAVLCASLHQLVVGQKWDNQTTSLERSYEKVLMRQKRFLLFPKGAMIICTMSLVKALILQGPRGYNMIAEIDFFYPLPATISDVKKHRKQPKPVVTTTAAPPPPPPPPEEHIYFDHDDHHNFIHDHEHPDLFTPPGGWQDDVISKLAHPVSVEKPTGNRRVYQVNSNPYWNNYPNWKPPPFLRRKAYEYRDKYQYFNERPPYSNNYLIPRGRSLEPSKQQGEPEDENITHRQRRDFFKSLEGAIDGFNLQPCLLRTVCEAQHYLMPKGKSLFHDIFKILFTMPSKGNLKDPYIRAMLRDKEECIKFYSAKCPISFIKLFLSSKRI